MSNFDQIEPIATPIDVQIRWSDQDVNGHVNHVRILTLVEEARIRATQLWMGTTPGANGPTRVIRALNTSFKQEVQYGKNTTIWVWVPRIGTTSFVFGQLVTQQDEPCVYAEATMVMIDAATGRAKPHDAPFRRALEMHAGPVFSAESPKAC
ncbi:MAG TPA: thioesterase family protein [Enteractinococcus sp.]